ncbi:MAG TPA: T6SS immunity protein Tdi1 domain-containing protein [Bacillota bacterium]
MELQAFIEKHRPEQDLQKVNQSKIDEYSTRLPACILELWQDYGFGSYSAGLIRLIDPEIFNEILYTWLGKKNDKRIPIALSAFGELFYYRDLDNGAEDVSILKVHYKSIDVCTWSLKDFFNDYLCDDEIIEEVLRQELFRKALEKYGPLKDDEIYSFVPALVMGGAAEVEFIKKANALVHLDILFQM